MPETLSQINAAIFLTLFLIPSLVAGAHSESLEIFPLKAPTRNLVHFSFDFQHQMNFESVVTNHAIFPRAFFDNLIVSAKVENLMMSLSMGAVNPIYFEDEYIPKFHLPQPGSQILANEDADLKKTVFALREVFGISAETLLRSNAVSLSVEKREKNVGSARIVLDFFGEPGMEAKASDTPFGSTIKNILFAADPNDFICVENIEKLKEFMPCGGWRGLFQILDQNSMFNSEHVSLVFHLAYDRETKLVKYRVEINLVVDNTQIGKQLQKATITTCKAYTTSKLFTYGARETAITEIRAAAPLPFANLSFPRKGFENATSNGFREKTLQVKKYMTEPWFSHRTDIVYELRNTHPKNITARVIVQEHLPYYLYPILHKIKVTIDGNEVDPKKVELDLEREQNGEFMLLRFFLFITPRSTLKLIIPCDRLMRNFEVYPHDHSRGHDLLGLPVFYQFYDHTKLRNIEIKRSTTNVEWQASETQTFKVPEPDFSMPFNIITFTFIFLGYFFLMVFRAATSKDKANFERKPGFKERILKLFGRETAKEKKE